MNLGGRSTPKSDPSIADAVAGEWDDDGAAANAWGTEDLIDVNADEDDWAAFESAPIADAVLAPQSYYVTPSAPASTSKTTHKPYNKVTPQPSPPKPAAVKKSTPVISSIPAPDASATENGWGSIDETERVSTPEPTAAPQPSLAGMSKDEKDKEMARRREERKAVGTVDYFEV